jgi:hypothetical protein
MKKKLTFVFFLLFVLCLSAVGLTRAQTWVPGVQGGEYFNYSITASWSSSDPSRSVPTDLIDLNNTLWYKFVVSYVSGSNVTATDIWHFVNGTEQNFLVTQDVASGTSYYMNAFQTVVAANLTVYDLLHPYGDDGIRVNQTIPRTYASGERDTNVVTLNFQDYNSTYDSYRTENVTYYFDKATGMLVESHDDTSYTNPTVTGSIVWKLMDSNVWSVSGSPATLYILIIVAVAVAIIVIALLVVVLFRRKGHKKKRQR